MAVFTKINKTDINKIENSFKLGKVINYDCIQIGIENTNYYLEFKNKKTVLTIFEKRVNSKDLPFFMNLMDELSKLKIVCPSPIKNIKGAYLFKIRNKKEDGQLNIPTDTHYCPTVVRNKHKIMLRPPKREINSEMFQTSRTNPKKVDVFRCFAS